MLNWGNRFSILLFLDNNYYPSVYNGYECLMAVGYKDGFSGNDGDLLTTLQNGFDVRPDWMFGHICYDYKNNIEPSLTSRHPVKTGFPNVHFFIPETVCYVNREQTILTIESYGDPNAIYAAFSEMDLEFVQKRIPQVSFTGAFGKDEYIATVTKLREHIAAGDCYEINLCNEGYAEGVTVNPKQVFDALNGLSPAPFSAFYRMHDKYMMCSSPERYLRREGRHIMSQPIKGTARRDKDPAIDREIKHKLKNDIKERAENVMIVDLVRNDLARCSESGSVNVEELFGVYSFPQVHQLISTVSGLLRKGAPFTDALRYSFPMGSMTGAPKYKVMQLIDHYERSRRELFSGTVGYISPDGNFDFNVVIRSMFYNEGTQYLSYQTGGAITYDSDPEKEWDEMRLKAWAMERIFS